jgi:hypothetical protein
VRHWWQTEPLQWRYARPAAMLAMKIEDRLAGGTAAGVHAFGLFWHFLTSLLVYLLAVGVLGCRRWGLLAGVLFAIQPHSVFAVSWTAARNALTGGCFFAAAAGCYWLAARRSTALAAGGLATGVRSAAGPLIAAMVLWAVALLSRETSVVFAPLALGIDAALGGRGLARRRLGVHALLWLLTGGYLWWRLAVFPTSSPPGIYFTPPEDLASLPWAASKLLQLVFSLWFHTPMLLGLATWGGQTREVATHALMLLAVGLIAWWYVAASRGLPGRWLWPAWVVLAFAPVVPVFLMPHFAYLPAIAASVMLAAMLRGVPGCKWRVAVVGLVVAANAWSLLVYRVVWRGVVRSEQIVYAEMAALVPEPPPAGTRLYFINLPPAAIYSTVAMRAVWKQPELAGQVLTYADHPLAMRGGSEIRVLDGHTLELIASPPGWFAGLGGVMLLDGMRAGRALREGETIDGDGFRVTVGPLGGDGGVLRLAVRFDQPLDDESRLFFWCTPEGVRRVRFEPGGALRVDEPPVDELLMGMRLERERYFWIEGLASRWVSSGLFLSGPPAADMADR